jgi:cytoskeletal protein CcmA (bactofilin family)
MSLLKLKSKTEPLYKSKIIINYEDDVKKESLNPINSLKEKSSLIIGEGATIKGEINEENEITIQGNVDGDIKCEDLIIGKTGTVKGKIIAETVFVEGSIEGEILVKGLLKLMSSSYVSGKINYGSLQINEGGKLIGELDFKDKNIVQEEFKDWKTL